jgi:hypothetical protein
MGVALFCVPYVGPMLKSGDQDLDMLASRKVGNVLPGLDG